MAWRDQRCGDAAEPAGRHAPAPGSAGRWCARQSQENRSARIPIRGKPGQVFREQPFRDRDDIM
ncbi:hypothetical protein Axi01nite_41030 [Actinoplanes xinjiangensis]|nr:hypothetical protein Axi01nite_41030 [Actinoplanes xinjiangensis]